MPEMIVEGSTGVSICSTFVTSERRVDGRRELRGNKPTDERELSVLLVELSPSSSWMWRSISPQDLADAFEREVLRVDRLHEYIRSSGIVLDHRERTVRSVHAGYSARRQSSSETMHAHSAGRTTRLTKCEVGVDREDAPLCPRPG
jgi:hypothetical protein